MDIDALSKASKDLSRRIEDDTSHRYELNPRVVFEPGWKNFLGSIESNLFRVLPTILKYIKENPHLLNEVKEGDTYDQVRKLRPVQHDDVHSKG